MRRTKRLKPMLTLLLAAVMVLGLIPAQPAAAEDLLDIVPEPYICCRVKVAKVTSGGTDSDMYCDVNFVDNSTYSFKMDKGSYNDFEQGDNDCYWFSIKKPVWMIKSYDVRIDGSDGVAIEEIEIGINSNPNSNNTCYHKVRKTYSGDDRWLDGAGDEKTLTPSLKRQLNDNSYKNFTEAFEKTVYVEPGADPNTTTEARWVPWCNYDGIFYAYNPSGYDDKPTLDFTVETSANGSNAWVKVTSGSIFSVFSKNKDGTGFTYKAAALYDEMAKANCVGVKLRLTLKYETRSSSGTTSKTVEYKFFRKQFGIKDDQVRIASSSYSAAAQNYFFNAANRQVRIQIPIQPNVNYAVDQISSAAVTEAYLFYGNGSNDFLKNGTLTYESSGTNGYLYATFTIDKDFNPPAGSSAGIKLMLQGVTLKFKDDSVYQLFDLGSFTISGTNNTLTARKVEPCGTEYSLGNGAYYKDFSEYKVDNVAPTISFREDGASGSSAFTGKWNKQTTLLTRAGETIYTTDSGHAQGYITLSVLNGNNAVKVRVGNNTAGVTSFTVPSTDTEYGTNITLYGKYEYNNLSVKVTGQDFAGNVFDKTYTGLKLDTMPPRVTLQQSNTTQDNDGARSASFTFNIEEASGTGRVYYCFVRNGENPQGTGSEHSGVITDLIGQWCFVSQNSSSTTAILKLDEGGIFDGTLHYYAIDDQGNQTGTTYKEIHLHNEAAECSYTVNGGEAIAHPLPEYEILFTPGEDCNVYYRYKTDPESAYTLYVAGTSKPGDTYAATGKLLTGQQILEYKVHNTQSGNWVSFEGDNGIILVFDNEEPQLTLTRTSSGSSLAAQSFSLGATDISGIASARYEVLNAADESQVAASGDLTLVSGTGVLQTGLSTADIAGLENGSYKLRFYATDRNGTTASTTSGAFSIRVQPPAAAVTAVNGAAPGDPTVTGSIDYSLTLTVSDAFVGGAGTHNAYYRVSGDSSSWSDWFKLAELTATAGGFFAEGTIDNLPALREGMNYVYVQVICAESDKNLSTESISASGIFMQDPPVSILLDTTAPVMQWDAACGRNNTALAGTVTVSDGVTPYPTVACTTEGVELIRDTGNANRYQLVYNVPADKFVPDNITVLAADEAGNTAVLTIIDELALLDLEGPQIAFSTSSAFYGDRTDAEVTVQLIDDHPGYIDVLFNEQEGSGRYGKVRDNHDGTYTVFLRGYNSTAVSPFTVLAYDDLGNETLAEAPPVTVVYPELTLVGLFSQPAFAQASTTVGLEFNVPALAVPIYAEQSGNETLAEAADRAFQEAGSRLNSLRATTDFSTNTSSELRHSVYSVTADAVAYELEKEYGGSWASCLGEYGEGDWPCYIMAEDEFGNRKYYMIRPDTQFEVEFPIDLVVRQYYGGELIDTFPENTIVVGTHVPDPSVDPDGTPTNYTAAVVVRAYNLRDAEGNFYLRQTDGGVYTYLDQNGRVLSAEEFAAEATGVRELDYALFPYTILTAEDSRVADLSAPGAEDYDGKGTLLRFDRSSGDTIEIPAGEYGWAFAQLAFDVNGEAEAVMDSSTVSVGYVNHPGSAAGTPQTVYIRSFTASGSGSAAEVELNPADIWLNETLQTGPIFAAQPKITKSWRQSSIAAEVELDVTASSAGAETKLIKVLKKTEDGWTVIGQWTGEGYGPNLSVTVTEEGTYCVYAEDAYGLSTLSEEFDITIRTDPITEDDFNITMEAYDFGWVTVADDSLPTAQARFTVAITDSGRERGLTVQNPQGGVVTLTYESPACSLVLTDDYGYRYETLLTYGNLIPPPAPDVTAPTVGYRFTNENKTNKPYEVLINAEDEESGVMSVTLAGGGVTIPLTGEGGVWTGTISKNGSYMITAEDRAGNMVKQTFSVMNIDDSPVTAELVYSTLALTQDIVTVTLVPNKHNVTITKMERTSGYASMDEAAKRIYFPENGTVSVWFRDEYGNVGVAVASVSNIYDEPPRLKAVPVLAADGLSVSVTFEMETDGSGAPLDIYRKLGDLTVIQNGVSYSADKARYVLRDNGVYTFTVVDQVGLMQVIEVEVKNIDRDAPVVTSVSWSYTYLDAAGNERTAVYNLEDVTGEGYRIAIDKYYRTNRDVTVSVTTDKPTTIIGSHDGEAPVLKHELIYHENGMYVYNLQKTNGLFVSYGVDVEIIDKTPPVIELEGPSYLLFVEGRDTGSVRDMLTDYAARDEYLGRTTDLTGAVRVDFGGLDPDTLENNTFDKSKPFTVQYAVKDAAGNETIVTRTVVLVSMNDVLVTVNGVLPSAASLVESDTGDLKLELINFSGAAYAAFAAGMRTFGQMKTMGTVLKQENGAFRVTGLKRGWYTFFIQTETRDYFNIYVFVD